MSPRSTPLRPLLPALLLAAAALALAPLPAAAQSVWPPPATVSPQAPRPDELAELKAGGKAGLGLAVGSRPGLTFRIWPKRSFAFNIGLGSTWLLNSLSADVSVTFVAKPSRNAANTVAALFYAGGGLRTRIWFGDPSFVELGVRVPVGVSVLVPGWKAEPFVEAAPSIVFYPNLGFDIEGLVGVRYYF